MTSERPGNLSCDLRANETAQNKMHLGGTTYIQHTDITTTRLTRPRGPAESVKRDLMTFASLHGKISYQGVTIPPLIYFSSVQLLVSN